MPVEVRNAIAQPQCQLQTTFNSANNKAVHRTRDQVAGFLRETALPLRYPQSLGVFAGDNFQSFQFDCRIIGLGKRVPLLGNVRHFMGSMEEHVV